MENHIKEALTDDLVKEAIKYYDIDESKLKYLGGFENFVYEYEKNNESYILRLVHSSHRIYNYVLAEIEFIDYLYINGANVSKIVKSINNQVSEKVDINKEDYFTVTAFEKADGEPVDKARKDKDKDFNYMFGKAVGKLHSLTKKYKPIHKRYHWYEEDYIGIGRRSLKEEDMFIIDKTLVLIDKLKKLPMDEESYGLIHTDLHFGNMLYDNNKLTFYDFDDSSYKHFISDIAIIIFYQYWLIDITEDEKADQVFNLLVDFCKGYLEENDLSIDWFDHINDFFKLRESILYFVISGAGEEMVNSPFGKKYLTKYRERILNDVPFLNDKFFIKLKKLKGGN